MNVKKLHLPFKLPISGEARASQSARISSRHKPDGPHINPRIRAYGKARLDIARRVQTQEDWDALWRPPTHAFPFAFSQASSWKQCLEYHVDDFAAEVGFWIDILGLQVIAFSPDYVQFNSPGGEFTFAVSSTFDDQPSTPPWSLRIQFYVQNLSRTVQELESRSISFDRLPMLQHPDSPLYSATFSTPHGIPIDLVGEIEPSQTPVLSQAEPITPDPIPQESHRSPRQEQDFPRADQPASLDLLTWDDEQEQEQDQVPESKAANADSGNSLTTYAAWPVSSDIATQLNEIKRSRHFSEETPAYTTEPSVEDASLGQIDEEFKDFDASSDTQKSPREEEFSETITYEPID
jgi:hypothetical protein